MHTILLTTATWIPQEVRKLRGIKEGDKHAARLLVTSEDEGHENRYRVQRAELLGDIK